MASLSKFQRRLARHALGLPNRQNTAYRNHYVTGLSPEYDAWMAMVGYGFAKTKVGTELTGGEQLFWLTYEGALAALDAGEGLDRERRYSRAERANG